MKGRVDRLQNLDKECFLGRCIGHQRYDHWFWKNTVCLVERLGFVTAKLLHQHCFAHAGLSEQKEVLHPITFWLFERLCQDS